MTLLLALFLALQDPDQIVEKFTSESPEVRQKTADELADQGKDALPLLRKLEKHDNAEVRARAKDVIQEILRRQELAAVRPPLKRISLTLKDLGLIEAMEKIFQPFGLDAELPLMDLKDKTISIHLKNATLWEALDAFCKAAELRPSVAFPYFGQSLKFRPAGPKPDITRVWDKGAVRLLALPIVYGTHDDQHGDAGVYLHVLLPPGSRPLDCRVNSMKLLTDGEDELKTRMGGQRRGLRVEPGSLTTCLPWGAVAKRKDLEGKRTFSVKGSLVMVYPDDAIRTEYGIKELKGATTKNVAGGKLTIQSVNLEKSEQSIVVKWTFLAKSDSEPSTFYISAEDNQGNRLGSIGSMRVRFAPTGSKQVKFSGALVEEPDQVARLVVTHFTGKVEEKIPFLITDIPIPDVPK